MNTSVLTKRYLYINLDILISLQYKRQYIFHNSINVQSIRKLRKFWNRMHP